jgi:hypothetical protein
MEAGTNMQQTRTRHDSALRAWYGYLATFFALLHHSLQTRYAHPVPYFLQLNAPPLPELFPLITLQ